MVQFRKTAFLAMIVMFATTAFAQDARVMVVDLQRAVLSTVEGKKAEAQFNAKLDDRRAAVAKVQKDLTDNQNKLATQGRALSETAVAELNRSIAKETTDVTRMSEDAQKELDELRQQLLQPLQDVSVEVIQRYAAEKGYTAVFDISAPSSNVIWYNKTNEVTDDIVKLIDTVTSAPPASSTPAAPAAKAPAAPAAPATPPKAPATTPAPTK